MKILFVEDDSFTIFAISQDAVIGPYWYEELIWAEIDTSEKVSVRWEDDWMTPVGPFDTLDAAKFYIKDQFETHKPYSNGPRKEVNV